MALEARSPKSVSLGRNRGVWGEPVPAPSSFWRLPQFLTRGHVTAAFEAKIFSLCPHVTSSSGCQSPLPVL